MLWQYFLSIAGIILQIDTDHPLVENEAFRPFLVRKTEPDCRAVFERVDELPAYFRHKNNGCNVYPDGNGGFRKIFFESPCSELPYAVSSGDISGKAIRVQYLKQNVHCVSELHNCFYHLGIETLMICKERLCFHAACIQTALGGILFSGQTGIGKSTQARLWEKHRGVIQINGDRPILEKKDAGWVAWGSPYAGSSRCYVNDNCPVTAIVMLRQAKECSLRRLSLPEAFRAVWAGLTVPNWDSSFAETASKLAVDLIGSVPIFEFACTPDEAAVDYLERKLRKECGL